MIASVMNTPQSSQRVLVHPSKAFVGHQPITSSAPASRYSVCPYPESKWRPASPCVREPCPTLTSSRPAMVVEAPGRSWQRHPSVASRSTYRLSKDNTCNESLVLSRRYPAPTIVGTPAVGTMFSTSHTTTQRLPPGNGASLFESSEPLAAARNGDTFRPGPPVGCGFAGGAVNVTPATIRSINVVTAPDLQKPIPVSSSSRHSSGTRQDLSHPVGVKSPFTTAVPPLTRSGAKDVRDISGSITKHQMYSEATADKGVGGSIRTYIAPLGLGEVGILSLDAAVMRTVSPRRPNAGGAMSARWSVADRSETPRQQQQQQKATRPIAAVAGASPPVTQRPRVSKSSSRCPTLAATAAAVGDKTAISCDEAAPLEVTGGGSRPPTGKLQVVAPKILPVMTAAPVVGAKEASDPSPRKNDTWDGPKLQESRIVDIRRPARAAAETPRKGTDSSTITEAPAPSSHRKTFSYTAPRRPRSAVKDGASFSHSRRRSGVSPPAVAAAVANAKVSSSLPVGVVGGLGDSKDDDTPSSGTGNEVVVSSSSSTKKLRHGPSIAAFTKGEPVAASHESDQVSTEVTSSLSDSTTSPDSSSSAIKQDRDKDTIATTEVPSEDASLNGAAESSDDPLITTTEIATTAIPHLRHQSNSAVPPPLNPRLISNCAPDIVVVGHARLSSQACHPAEDFVTETERTGLSALAGATSARGARAAQTRRCSPRAPAVSRSESLASERERSRAGETSAEDIVCPHWRNSSHSKIRQTTRAMAEDKKPAVKKAASPSMQRCVVNQLNKICMMTYQAAASAHHQSKPNALVAHRQQTGIAPNAVRPVVSQQIRAALMDPLVNTRRQTVNRAAPSVVPPLLVAASSSGETPSTSEAPGASVEVAAPARQAQSPRNSNPRTSAQPRVKVGSPVETTASEEPPAIEVAAADGQHVVAAQEKRHVPANPIIHTKVNSARAPTALTSHPPTPQTARHMDTGTRTPDVKSAQATQAAAKTAAALLAAKPSSTRNAAALKMASIDSTPVPIGGLTTFDRDGLEVTVIHIGSPKPPDGPSGLLARALRSLSEPSRGNLSSRSAA